MSYFRIFLFCHFLSHIILSLRVGNGETLRQQAVDNTYLMSMYYPILRTDSIALPQSSVYDYIGSCIIWSGEPILGTCRYI